ILDRAAEAERRGATEMHIVGGLHHQLPYEWYLNVIRLLHDAHPRLHLKAYTAVEWDWFERLTGRPVKDLLGEVKEGGLGGRAWGACPAAGRRSSTPRCATRSASTRPTRTPGSAPTARRTGWACAPTPPCSTATSRSRATASTT